MRHRNGSGTIKKLSGNRRRPYAYVISIDGKQKPIEYFATLLEAEKFRAGYCDHKDKKGNITFLECYSQWFKFHLSKATPAKTTIANYEIAFKHCSSIHYKAMQDIKYIHLQAIIDDMLASGLSYSSVKKVRSVVSLVYKYGLRNDYVSKNYAGLLLLGKNKPVYPHKPFTRHKINRLWKLAKDDYIVQSVLVLIYTGLRVGELLQLDKGNINNRGRYIKVTKSKTKAGLRVIPIHPSIWPFIHNVVANIGGLKYSKYRKLFDKAMQRINGKHRPHDTRHTFASMLDDVDVSYNAKRLLLGHAGTNVTDGVYTHKTIVGLRKAINKLR